MVQKEVVRRIYVEKKTEFAVEARRLLRELKENLSLPGLTGVRVVYRYDVEGLSEAVYREARHTVFADPTVDLIYDEELPVEKETRVLAVEYLPGQYDQRAVSLVQCLQILTPNARPAVRVAKLLLLAGEIDDREMQRIKDYCINPLESREASPEKPATLVEEYEAPEGVTRLTGFTAMTREELETLRTRMNLVMSRASLEFCRDYFRDTERREPTVTELRVLDTYWSDHCRHLTFLTGLEEVEFAGGPYADLFRRVYERYLASRRRDGREKRAVTLMDLATAAMREMREKGLLPDLEVSDEINASSIVVEAEVDGETQEWLVMFKNETHNHPTEIEPFGGAATCLGGAIRDPLSGRAYVYQALRLTGSGDPRPGAQETLPGKLPQYMITTQAAAGYSSYGNQVGVAAGLVAEVYDEGFLAKRMEMGAVIGAAPRENVRRNKPVPGDVVILLGGRTGRDGCGGATGSSRTQTEESLFTCGAEVQKGDPVTERKIQRLFRRPEVARMIKKCNDFGAGGVAVAVGELAEGLEINLDVVPTKYAGLDGTELAISESQERMAVVVAGKDAPSFIRAAREENLEAAEIAVVTPGRRIKMFWRGETILDLDRAFLDSGGVRPTARVKVGRPEEKANVFRKLPAAVETAPGLAAAWLQNLQRLNVCSQRGLVEMFDSTVGAGTVLMPLGGIYQLTPAECAAAKLPVVNGRTTTGTLMTYGYNPVVGKWSPFHGALYAVVEAVAKIAAAGGDYRRIRLTLQEYFERLEEDPEKWGKPFAALLGAYHAQTELGIPAVGGKDSMSGSFKDLDVPPTVVAVAVCPVDVRRVISPEFKRPGSRVVLLPVRRDENELPDFRQLKENLARLYQLIGEEKILAAQAVKDGGTAAALSKMAFGNGIGLDLKAEMERHTLFLPAYGSLLLEIPAEEEPARLLAGLEYRELGVTLAEPVIRVNGVEISLAEAVEKWEEPLATVFPTRNGTVPGAPPRYSFSGEARGQKAAVRIAKPRVFIPVFPGTNGEYDTAEAFRRAGGLVETLVLKNLTPREIEESLAEMVKMIKKAQILVLPGGPGAGDGAAGAGALAATVLSRPAVREAVMEFLQARDGLILGVGSGFQALIKLGLVPYGEFREADGNGPALTVNALGRHVSRMARVKVVSTLSPWLQKSQPGEIYTLPVSHGEGRLVARAEELAALAGKGQVATQYVDPDGNPTLDPRYNPGGSTGAVEGMTSPDGRVLGCLAHPERSGAYVGINVPGAKEPPLFAAGIAYFL